MVHCGIVLRISVVICVELLLSAKLTYANYWRKGIVYYIVDTKTYDLYSRTMIRQTFELMEKEICLQFPPAPKDLTPSMSTPVLYISNGKGKMDCTSQKFDFSGPVVKMIIGHKCVNNKKAIAGNILHMLKSDIKNKKPCDQSAINLISKFNVTSSLVSSADRCFVNHNYFIQCMERPDLVDTTDKDNETQTTTPLPKYRQENYDFYDGILWPLAAVYYEVEPMMRYTVYHDVLTKNMALIEKETCIKFYDVKNVQSSSKDEVKINGELYFGARGAEQPNLGFMDGQQTLNLTAFAAQPPGYASHTLNLLMRILGVPMMSNRHDRDSYIFVNYDYIDDGKMEYLNKEAIGAWFQIVPYDFSSVTHAPHNYMCSACRLGMCSVDPIQDDNWEKVTVMGQSTQLSKSDKLNLELMYSVECETRVS